MDTYKIRTVDGRSTTLKCDAVINESEFVRFMNAPNTLLAQYHGRNVISIEKIIEDTPSR